MAALLLVLAGCTGSNGDPAGEAAGEADGATTDASASDDGLAVTVASYDLAVGEDQRLIAGVFTSEGELLGFGDVTFELGFVGDQHPDEVELPQRTTAGFLPVPGIEPEGESTEPTLLVGQEGAGVYEAEVDFDQPGTWKLQVTAELADGTTREGETVFPVQEEHLVPAVGDEAPPSENLTIEDAEAGRVEPTAVDSRAQDGAEIPDPHLHRTTIASSIEEGRPVVVVFATPVYCVSRFCGPLAEVTAELATRYEDRADFVMVEVWKDFEASPPELNEAAAEWIQTEQGGNEPWVFLVGEDGRIAARWDNVLDRAELEAMLDELPAIPPRAESTPPSDDED